MGRIVPLIFCLIPCLLACTKKEALSIRKVEHIYISTNQAPEAFRRFSAEWGLPVVWDYQSWGSFSSGGLTLGNVVIEWVGSPGPRPSWGIALEPDQALAHARLPAGFSHGPVSRSDGWSTQSLTGLLPEEVNLFLCDYHDRAMVAAGRKKAADKLRENSGGTLGIQSLEEIVIGAPDAAEREKAWAHLPGSTLSGGQILFREGPNMRLVPSDAPSFVLVLKVASLELAKKQLDSLSIKTRPGDRGLGIADDAFPVSMVLVE